MEKQKYEKENKRENEKHKIMNYTRKKTSKLIQIIIIIN